jgi:PadR family transcriptional regulator, regulatory protein PadR
MRTNDNLIPQATSPKSELQCAPLGIYNPLTEFEESLLRLLLGRPMYGKQIVQAFREASNGEREISLAVLYPALNRLVEKRCLTCEIENRQEGTRSGASRKYYRITQTGAKRLAKADEFRERLENWNPHSARVNTSN